MTVRLGFADHLGWAVVVAAAPDHTVVDRRRIELVSPDLPAAPVHHCGGAWEAHSTGAPLSDVDLADLVRRVRASAAALGTLALDRLEDELPGSVRSMSLRTWPADFPTDMAVQRRIPHESRADAVMYRQVLAELAGARGWAVHTYDARSVEQQAAAVLGGRADDVLHRPRTVLGPPWTKDHRMALAATVVAT